jgi:hypothetical protein
MPRKAVKSVMVWVTCRECGRDFDCVEDLPAHLERLCALCDRPGSVPGHE